MMANAATVHARDVAAAHDARLLTARMLAAWYLDAAASAHGAVMARDAGGGRRPDPHVARAAVLAEAAGSADRMTAALGILEPSAAADVAALAWRILAAILEGMPDRPALEGAA